jgi:MFS superfamily sulfate permease-like transporter
MTFPVYRRLRARLIGLVCGVAVFLWLRIEDQNVLFAVLCGISLAVASLGIYAWKLTSGRRYPAQTALIGGVLFGGLCGLASALVTAILMLLKNGFHAHLFPDFPFGMISDMLLRAPIWALAGALIGFGVMAAALAGQPQVESSA